MRRIGLYGGSFDPVHIGHLALAIELLEWHALDAVWLLPTRANPLREQLPVASAEHRVAMLRLATTSISELSIREDELLRTGPSYTVDTLYDLHRSNEAQHYFLLLGEDVLSSFPRWHRVDEILSLATPIIGSRSQNLPVEWEEGQLVELLKRGLTPTRRIDVSSSEIRARVRSRRHIEHLVPQGVCEYIQRHELYL